MHINVVKTITEENDAKVNIDGQAIENVKIFVYLGSEFTWIMTVAKTYKDYSRNSSVQRVTIYIWKDSGIMTEVKLQILMTIVFPVLL